MGVAGIVEPSFADVLAARGRIIPHIWPTPLLESAYLSELTGGRIFLKLESRQRLGAFKVRGMVNRILTLDRGDRARARGIVVASSGNHGVAASWAGNRWNVRVEVYAPRTTPHAKTAKIERYGAALRLVGENYDEAYLAAKAAVAGGGRGVWVDPCSDPEVVAGHGTIGLEICDELPEVDEILVPVGGGGLITGISVVMRHLRPSVRISGVQTEACPAMLAAMQDGVWYETYPTGPSVCEALVGGVGELGFQASGRAIDRVALASEPAIERAVVEMLQHEQVLAEPSGAIGWAYVTEHPDEFAGRTAALVITGQNIDFDLLRQLIQRHG